MTDATPNPLPGLPDLDAVHEAARPVLQFWFGEATPRDWFAKSDAFDARIRERFAALLPPAAAGALAPWRSHPAGRLAEVLVMDQFPRNLHRDSAEAFALDPLALQCAREAVAVGADAALPVAWRAFLYMPFMHSEQLAAHEQALVLFSQPGLASQLAFEHRHHDIIRRFGRYPHRNAVLGRASTPDELAFLQTPGSSF